MCQGCGLQPQAYHGRRFCYDCKPGTNGRPLPCRRCGATGDYWSERLCRRCHQHAPQLPDSCRDCLAWGATRTLKWLCAACTGWRHRYPGTSGCVSCRRDLALNEHQACRLCWFQTFLYQAQAGLARDVGAANQGSQQLWLANMANPRNGYKPHTRRDYTNPRDQIQPPGPDLRTEQHEPAHVRTPDPDQLDLFAHDRLEATARRFGFGEPPSARFADVLDQHVLDHAARHGWTHRQTIRTRITLRVLQARHRITSGPINATVVLGLTDLDLSVRLALTVLADNDLLLDDRVPPLHRWFARQIADLPDPMAAELQTWFDVLHYGSTTAPRSHPRHDVTIKTRTLWAMPTLRAWARAGHQSLREVSRDDVLAVLPAQGTPRVTLGNALRSIFTTLKRHRVLFVNPMARMRIGNLERRIPMPIDTTRIREAFDSADTTTAAITTLIGIHGLRPGEACALMLTDVRDHRIVLPDRTILLAAETKARLDAYLAHRRDRWPGSVNAHFLIHTRSASTLEQVKVPWLTDKLGMSANTLRQDRILAEVHAGGDLRQICDFFGVTIATAEHYASTLNHLELDEFTTGPSGSRTATPY
jgi:site-specific recombinase XerD